MDIIRIVGIGLIGAVTSIVIRNLRPELSMIIPIIVSFTVMACVMPYMTGIARELEGLADSIGIGASYMRVVVKMIGVAYLTSISAELCKDAGENAIASKIELGGKLVILSLSIPIINRLLSLIREIMR